MMSYLSKRVDVIKLLSDGGEETITRERARDIEPLRTALQRKLDSNQDLMEQLRDTAVLLLASEKLEQARDTHREQQAAALVNTYSKRAVVGALAASSSRACLPRAWYRPCARFTVYRSKRWRSNHFFVWQGARSKK